MADAREGAETVALQALGWLVAQEDLLEAFLGASGSSPEDLRQRAGEPEFLGAVLDFLLTDDAWVMRFCTETGLAFDLPVRARAALPGGAQVHWT
jgi:hypothetical protein